MEKGDTDLASFLKDRRKKVLDEALIRFYWREMLQCVKAIHSEGKTYFDCI
jgi:hypothetical protein